MEKLNIRLTRNGMVKNFEKVTFSKIFNNISDNMTKDKCKIDVNDMRWVYGRNLRSLLCTSGFPYFCY